MARRRKFDVGDKIYMVGNTELTERTVEEIIITKIVRISDCEKEKEEKIIKYWVSGMNRPVEAEEMVRTREEAIDTYKKILKSDLKRRMTSFLISAISIKNVLKEIDEKKYKNLIDNLSNVVENAKEKKFI